MVQIFVWTVKISLIEWQIINAYYANSLAQIVSYWCLNCVPTCTYYQQSGGSQDFWRRFSKTVLSYQGRGLWHSSQLLRDFEYYSGSKLNRLLKLFNVKIYVIIVYEIKLAKYRHIHIYWFAKVIKFKKPKIIIAD